MICNYCLKLIEKDQEVFEGSRGTWHWDDQKGYYHIECLEKCRREQKKELKNLIVLIEFISNGLNCIYHDESNQYYLVGSERS